MLFTQLPREVVEPPYENERIFLLMDLVVVFFLVVFIA